MAFKRFILITPLLIIFGIGILFRTTDKVKAEASCSTTDMTRLITDEFLAKFEGHEVVAVALAMVGEETDVLGVASLEERWIEVDLSEQKLRAWDGNQLYLETLISTGLPHTPTP